MRTLDELRAKGNPVLLLFADPDCGPCRALLPEVGRWQHRYGSRLTLAVVSRGTPEANRQVTRHAVTHILLQQKHEVAETYQEDGTPGAVLILPDGTIGSPLAQGADAIHALVARAVNLPEFRSLSLNTALNGDGTGASFSPTQPTGPKVGEPAPAFTLPDLDGQPVSLSDFHGSPLIILFWNPGCSFCQQMLQGLKSWATNRPVGAPIVLIVSQGTVKENKAVGLPVPVVLDASSNVERLFGAVGTPVALLVDAQGNIASDLAEGSSDVLALLAGSQKVAQPATR
jgi:thiol-disulfide isomerase/thioredoxin